MITKLLIFAPMPPTITGGIEEYAYSVAEAMKHLGFHVTIITSKLKDDDNNTNSDIIYVNSSIMLRRPFPIGFSWLLLVARAIAMHDVIHIHMPYPIMETYVAFIAKMQRKKMIVTYHMDPKIDSQSFKKSMVNSIIETMYYLISMRYALKSSNVICSNTKAYADSSPILSKYKEKIVVVHQGIRKDLYDFLDRKAASEIREKYLEAKYSHIVTFVGRLVPYKGLHYLLEAIRLIEDKSIVFLIAGEGPQKQYLINLSNNLDIHNVRFLGYVRDQDLFNLYAASDIVVSPSISELESTPITLLSALAVGTPAIGTSVGGTAETIPNDGINGSIIPARDSKILAQTIIAMLDNNSNRNKERTKHCRFWSDVAKDYSQIIQRLLSSSLDLRAR